LKEVLLEVFWLLWDIGSMIKEGIVEEKVLLY